MTTIGLIVVASIHRPGVLPDPTTHLSSRKPSRAIALLMDHIVAKRRR